MTSLARLDRVALRRLIEVRLRDRRTPIDRPGNRPFGIVPSETTCAVEAQVLKQLSTSPVAAAVLVPIVDHAHGLTVLFTHRAAQLRTHAGQISFPGGRVERSDASPLQAALRETEEEIGLAREQVTFAGYLEPQLVRSGFWITPVVGFVQPDFSLKLQASEVSGTFEVPLHHILDCTHHRSHPRLIGETTVLVYDIPYGEHNIWGATAGILMALYRLLAAPAPADEMWP